MRHNGLETEMGRRKLTKDICDNDRGILAIAYRAATFVSHVRGDFHTRLYQRESDRPRIVHEELMKTNWTSIVLATSTYWNRLANESAKLSVALNADMVDYTATTLYPPYWHFYRRLLVDEDFGLMKLLCSLSRTATRIDGDVVFDTKRALASALASTRSLSREDRYRRDYLTLYRVENILDSIITDTIFLDQCVNLPFIE